MNNDVAISKGGLAEESLRLYFLSLGYFTVRDLPFTYKTFDVTDIDLWLYIKSSSLVRERTCVDVKNKKTPQAMERVFWTKGLREVLGVDRAVVATTDNRPETRDFGVAHGVTVLHGDFISRALKGYSPSKRITEEQFYSELEGPCIVKSDLQWRQFFKEAKAKLLTELTFNGCNSFLEDINFLLNEYICTNKDSSASIRLLYALIAYFLITLDYTSRLFASLDTEGRTIQLTDGFRYGESGRERNEEVVEFALRLLMQSGKSDLFSYSTLKNEVNEQLSAYPAEMLSEYFAKPEVSKQLFAFACEWEKLAYSSALMKLDQCTNEQKALLGLLCDFFKIDRKQVI